MMIYVLFFITDMDNIIDQKPVERKKIRGLSFVIDNSIK